MQDLQQMFPRLRSYIFLILALFVLGWGFTEYQSVFLGLILGTVFSLYNLWILVRRERQFGQAVEQGRKVKSVGTFTRFATAALGVIIALRYPEEVHLVAFIMGLMTFYFVIIIDFIIQSIRYRWEER
jgi:ATP synthase protein I